MKRFLAILLLVTPAWARPPDCKCMVVYYTPPSPLRVCLARNDELAGSLGAYKDLVKEYRTKVSELEKLLARDPPNASQIVKETPARAKKVRKVSKVKGCKRGRTRNSRGVCGRW